LLNHRGISNNNTCIDKSSNIIGRPRACYGANKPSNLVVTSNSYIEKTKMLMYNNKAMKAAKHPKRDRRQNLTSTKRKIIKMDD